MQNLLCGPKSPLKIYNKLSIVDDKMDKIDVSIYLPVGLRRLLKNINAYQLVLSYLLFYPDPDPDISN